MHIASIKGSSRLVKQLLQMGADPNAQDNAEWSPLHEACNRGNLGVVKVLIEGGANINLQGFGKDSPLHDAARNGHLKVVKFLVRKNADLRAKNASNRTPREEAEVTRLRVPDNLELDKTVTYLIGQEEQGRKNLVKSDVSSDSDEDENNDIAKFLGLTKSPVVREALQTLGLSSPSPRKKRKKCKSVTPRKPESLPKVRLTYGENETKNIEDVKKIAMSSTKTDHSEISDKKQDVVQNETDNKVSIVFALCLGSPSVFDDAFSAIYAVTDLRTISDSIWLKMRVSCFEKMNPKKDPKSY